jgi:hypothetical protein
MSDLFRPNLNHQTLNFVLEGSDLAHEIRLLVGGD